MHKQGLNWFVGRRYVASRLLLAVSLCNTFSYPQGCRGFGATLQPWRWRQHASPKHWLLPTDPHGDLTQKNLISVQLPMWARCVELVDTKTHIHRQSMDVIGVLYAVQQANATTWDCSVWLSACRAFQPKISGCHLADCVSDVTYPNFRLPLSDFVARILTKFRKTDRQTFVWHSQAKASRLYWYTWRYAAVTSLAVFPFKINVARSWSCGEVCVGACCNV
jgi:hypothetical protein